MFVIETFKKEFFMKKEKNNKKYNKNRHLVQQSNALIETTQKMSLVERRLMYHVLSRINPKKPQQEYVLRVEDFAQDFPQMGSGTIYNQLKDAVVSLFKRSIQLLTERGTTKIFYLLQEQEYKDGEGYLRMKFSDSTMPLIFDLKEKFTTMVLENFKFLDSVHSLKLYELLYQYKSQGWREITVEDLRFFFGCEDTYPDFKLFKQKVIEPAMKEISEKSDLLVQAEYFRTGRFVTSVKFIFVEKTDRQIIDAECELAEVKNLTKKQPLRPALKRHPNPRKFDLDDYKSAEPTSRREYIKLKFAWAVENYKRITGYEKALKEYDSKMTLKAKDQELKSNYVKIMAECYDEYLRYAFTWGGTGVLDEIKEDLTSK